jgi:hypothetical protein
MNVLLKDEEDHSLGALGILLCSYAALQLFKKKSSTA